MSHTHNQTSHTIVCVGDSLMEAGSWAEWFPEHTVINQGVSGATTADVLNNVDMIVDARPDEILLMIGTNDLGTRRTVEHLVRNVQSLMVQLRREVPGARMLLHSILPRGRDFARPIREANIHLRQFAATVHAQYLDLWPAFATEDGQIDPRFSDDALHLNAAGYEAWLAELRPALERLRDEPPMSRPIQIIASRDEYSRPS
ncbi:MAG: hypothetical protein JWP30_706 [Homoserinimonas sp.]|jgi:lysophospholipase L1-like esterase|nr:hypothetical protein [Homoserinimonas sp.]